MGNTILAKGVNHIVAKGGNPACPKGSKSRGFSSWLQHTYKGRQEKLLEQGTVVAYISQLSIALNAAVRAEWLEENPFMLLSASERVKKPESKRQFLAIEEVKLLIATECRNMTVKTGLPVLVLLRTAPERHGNPLLERHHMQ